MQQAPSKKQRCLLSLFYLLTAAVFIAGIVVVASASTVGMAVLTLAVVIASGINISHSYILVKRAHTTSVAVVTRKKS